MKKSKNIDFENIKNYVNCILIMFRNKNANPPEIIHENVLDKVRRKEIAFREKLGLNKVKLKLRKTFKTLDFYNLKFSRTSAPLLSFRRKI